MIAKFSFNKAAHINHDYYLFNNRNHSATQSYSHSFIISNLVTFPTVLRINASFQQHRYIDYDDRVRQSAGKSHRSKLFHLRTAERVVARITSRMLIHCLPRKRHVPISLKLH